MSFSFSLSLFPSLPRVLSFSYENYKSIIFNRERILAVVALSKLSWVVLWTSEKGFYKRRHYFKSWMVISLSSELFTNKSNGPERDFFSRRYCFECTVLFKRTSLITFSFSPRPFPKSHSLFHTRLFYL